MTNYNKDNTTIAAYRVFETLKFLIKQPASVTDIIKHLEKLNINNGKPYSKGVIYKYIATLKFAGVEVIRNKCKYEINKLPFKIPFDDENLKTILMIEEIINKIPEKNLTKKIKELIYSLKMRSNENTIMSDEIKKEITSINLNEPTENQIKIIEKYEKYCTDKLKISIEYYDLYGKRCKINCEPIEIKYYNNQIYLYSYCEISNDFIELNSEQIIKITQLPTKCSEIKKKQFSRSTVYILSGKLAKRYKSRSDETTTNTEDTIIVSNKTEAKNRLLMRLMRYGILCEVKTPKTDRNKIKEIITKTLSNYNISI